MNKKKWQFKLIENYSQAKFYNNNVMNTKLKGICM